MDEDWRNAFGILMCAGICNGACVGICDGSPSSCSSFQNVTSKTGFKLAQKFREK